MNRIHALALLLGMTLASGTVSAQDGKAIYDERCAFCHGATGKGDGPASAALSPPPRDFTRAAYWSVTDQTRLRDIIQNGKDGTAMVPFRNLLNEQQTDAVINYLMTFRPAS